MKINPRFARKMSRRGFLATAGAAGAGLFALAALPSNGVLSPSPKVVSAAEMGEGSFQLDDVGRSLCSCTIGGGGGRLQHQGDVSLFADNSEALLKVQQVGGAQLDMVSADALWIPRFYEEGLIEPFDLWELDCAKGLFDVALNIPFWKTEDGLDLAFPFGWSPVMIGYNPKYVTPEPDSWQVLGTPNTRAR